MGPAGETAIALRRAQRKRENTERHPLTQGADADSTVYHPAADICRVNSPSARTHPKSKTRFALTNDIYSSAAPNGGAAWEALTSVLSKMGSSLPLPEQSKTPAHERANIRGRAFFMRKGMPIRCSPSGWHDCLYQCFLSFTQKKMPRRASLQWDSLAGVPPLQLSGFPCPYRQHVVDTKFITSKNLYRYDSYILKEKINDTLQPSSYGFSTLHNAATNCFYC